MYDMTVKHFMKTKIYLIENCYNDSNKVYIGKTINSRKSNHKKTYGSEIKYTIIDEIESLDYKKYKYLESYWIEQFRQWGFNVLNKNNGGGGPSKWSEELINSEQNRIRKEKIKNSPERSIKIKNKSKGKPLSEEHKQKLRVPKPNALGKKKRPRTLDEKIKISQKLKGRNTYWMKNKKQTDYNKKQVADKNSIPVLQYDLQDIFIKEWDSQIIACRLLNINAPSITNCLKNRSKTAGGYKWKYKTISNG